MQEVEAVCDRVIIINKGELVADDRTQNIQKKQDNKQVIVVEFDKQTTDTLLKNIPGITDVKHLGSQRWQLTAKANKDIRPDVFHFAVSNQLAVLAMQQEEQKLEDVFKELTK